MVIIRAHPHNVNIRRQKQPYIFSSGNSLHVLCIFSSGNGLHVLCIFSSGTEMHIAVYRRRGGTLLLPCRSFGNVSDHDHMK